MGMLKNSSSTGGGLGVRGRMKRETDTGMDLTDSDTGDAISLIACEARVQLHHAKNATTAWNLPIPSTKILG